MRLSEAARALSRAGIISSREEARKLFSHFERIPEYRLIADDPSTENEALLSAIRRRCSREPLQYIIGEVGFYNETYRVTPDCLIPREDTEALVDYAVKHLGQGAVFIDLCTGSGCVAISTLRNTVGTAAVAVDISEGALSVARDNALRLGVSERVELMQLDVLQDPPPCIKKFDAILSNPPYVADGVYPTLEKEIFHEPRLAFVGGADGADFYRHITKAYKHLLSDNGFIAYEIGYDQAGLLSEIASAEGMSCEIIHDLSGNARVAVLKHR